MTFCACECLCTAYTLEGMLQIQVGAFSLDVACKETGYLFDCLKLEIWIQGGIFK